MKISELVEKLLELKELNGDIDVYCSGNDPDIYTELPIESIEYQYAGYVLVES